MAESSVRTFKEVDREKLKAMTLNFREAVKSLAAIDRVSLSEQAYVVEHIGRRLRDELLADKLCGHAILAKQIMTIATTRMA